MGISNRCQPIPPEPRGASANNAKLCVDCGTVTTRHDPDGTPRCHGALPPLQRCAVCRWPMTTYMPDQTMHPNCSDPEFPRLVAITRDLESLGIGWCTCTDVRNPDGSCPHCKEFRRRLDTSDRAEGA